MTKNDFTAQSLFLSMQVSEDFWREDFPPFMFLKAQTKFKHGRFLLRISV